MFLISRILLALALVVAGCGGGSGPSGEAPGGYRFTRSSVAWTVDGPGQYSVLVPRSRKIWIASDGSGRLREEWLDPIFFGEGDRREWTDDSAADPVIDDRYAAGELAYVDHSQVPTEVAALRRYLQARSDATTAGAPLLLSDAMVLLRETLPSPELGTAVLEVLGSSDGIQRQEPVADREGREAIMLFADQPADPERNQAGLQIVAYLDPATGKLLGEERILLDPMETIDAEPPVTIGWATYLESRLVDDLEDR